MKTRKQILAITLSVLTTLLFTVNTSAQANHLSTKIVDLDTVNVNYKSTAVNDFVSDIITDKDFKYRKALKESKSSNKYYRLGDVEITEANLLKHFKKAARKSDSAEAFALYFKNINLSFIAALDQYVIEQLYNTIRQTTFNGFLDNWQKYY